MRRRMTAMLGGAMYALFAALGWQAERYGEVKPAGALIAALLLWLPLGAALCGLFEMDERRAEKSCRQDGFSALRAFFVMLACYVPMFAISFPGTFAYDVPFQLEQVFTGSYSTHHPLLHTLLMGVPVKLGHALGNINLGAALYTAVQMTALAACFACTCASIARQAGARAAKWSAAFFALYPLHMFMAVNATKDVLFSGLFVLTLALAREIFACECKDAGRFAALVMAGAGMMLLRNNAVYAAVVWLALLLGVGRRQALRTGGALLLAIVLSMGAGAALKTATGAVDGSRSEMLSWPIQQLARARNLHGDRLDSDEKTAIDELMPHGSWTKYMPTISDPVKFDFDTARFEEDPLKYAKIYLSVGMKCPKAYFDALLEHTYAFWYPYSEYKVAGYYLQMLTSGEHYEWCSFERIEHASPLMRVLNALAWRFGAKGAMQIPVMGYLFNMGVIVWAMLYFVLREAYCGRWRSFGCALLPVLLWGTFLLGPVMAGRYIYPFVCCLPVLASHIKEK